MPDYSIIIPTFNRLDVLPEVLTALQAQQNAPSFEVIVVDDGSEDGTWDWLQEQHFAMPVHCLRQENAGPARARNRGVEQAAGDRLAFLGDDTVPSTGWLAAHQQALERFPKVDLLAIIGYTGWHSRMRLNPFLRYINEYGLQFGYALIDQPEDVPFNFLYTSNLTLPRQALIDEPFDLGFPYPAWEDTELSYRLKKRGLKLVYEPKATVAHDHPTDLTRFMTRQEKAGYCAVVFHQLHPEMGAFLGLSPEGPPAPPSNRRQALYEILAQALQRFPVRTPRLWQEVLRFHYIQGLHRGWRDLVAGHKDQGGRS